MTQWQNVGDKPGSTNEVREFLFMAKRTEEEQKDKSEMKTAIEASQTSLTLRHTSLQWTKEPPSVEHDIERGRNIVRTYNSNTFFP